jgi:hypothetical protein
MLDGGRMPGVSQGTGSRWLSPPAETAIERSRLAPGSGAVDLSVLRPSQALLNAVLVQTWVQEARLGGFSGLVAFAMITPPDTTDGEFADIESEMGGLVTALRLASARSKLPDSGPRILPRLHTAWLRLDESPLQLRLPARAAWVELVRSGRPACLVVGLDVLPVGAGRGEIARYIKTAGPVDRAFMGLSRADPG